MTGNGESRARGPGSQGLGSPTSTQDIAPRQGCTVTSTITDGAVIEVLDARWLRAHGYPLAAAEHDRQSRMAAAALDARLRERAA